MAFKFPLSDLQLWRSTAVPDLGNKEGGTAAVREPGLGCSLLMS